MKRRAFLTTAILLALLWSAAASASATPILTLTMHRAQTNFPPGGVAEYWFDINNAGDSATTEPITLKVTLPSGLTRESVQFAESTNPLNWSCPGSPGAHSFTCTANESLARHSINENLRLSVNVESLSPQSLPAVRFASAKLEGGGAPEAPAAEGCAPKLVACAVEETVISPTFPGFGILASSFRPNFLEADEATPTRQAGAHPPLFVVPFDFNTRAAPEEGTARSKAPIGTPRNLHVDLPAGLIGNPTAVGECSQAEFTLNVCPFSSQVGRIDLRLIPLAGKDSAEVEWSNLHIGVFNLAHPRGAITDLGFAVGDNPVHVRVTLDPANHYTISATVPNINETLPVFLQKMTLWGVPADHSHDSERCPKFVIASFGGPTGDTSKECATDATPKPFLTLPAQCESPSTMRLFDYDSWQEPGVFGPEINYTLPGQFEGCDRPRFEPEAEIEPTGKQANMPTGLDVHVKVAQNENPDALGTPPVKSTTVTLPQGMSFSPSFADGLSSCSSAQIKLGTNEPVECPDSSRIGEVTLSTPLLPRQLEGSMYLAAQGDNPFGSLFGLYLVFHDDEERGILVKIPGKVEVDPLTGQITTTFDETPQFPFADLTLKFRSGPQAPLVNPPSCGQQAIGVKISSWAQPDKQLDVSSTYDINEGPNGTPCPVDSAHRPFSPSFTGGTLSPVAGAYSTFLFHMARNDAEQELSQITTTLPPGLSANISQIPLCPASSIESISTELGAGRVEQEHPACPAASQIGTVSAGLGAGPGPDYFPGKVYLSGPYKGAPLSLAVVAPGVAGPYDLGNVVVRAALYLDPLTAQITAVSDPFPTIFHGVILHVKDVRVRIDRGDTTLNPTSCEHMAVGAQITGVGGDLLSTADDSLFKTSVPFQDGDCASLAFKPTFKASTSGKTSRANGASLSVKLAYPKAPQGTQANIRTVKVDLPKRLPSRLTTLQKACTDTQFSANPAGCPAASRVGTAKAITPILPVPLEGPAYFVSHGGAKFPELILVLQGYGITIDLHGETFISKTGITSSTFSAVPDQPVTSFELNLPQGPNSALAANGNLCTSTLKMPTLFTAQNGVVIKKSTPIAVTGCPKKKTKHKAKKAPKAGHRHTTHTKKKG